MKLLSICALASAGSLLWGQAGNVVGPSAGYVFDAAAKVLRPVRGIPGAALLGDAIDLGITPNAIEVAPRGDTAIAVAADGSAHLFRLSNGIATERPVGNLMSSPASVVFSPSGTAVALYRPGSVQVLRGLPDSPEAGITLTLPSMGSVAAEAAAARRQRPSQIALAISDDGAYLLLARAGEVDLFSIESGTRKLMDSQAGALVAFAGGGHDAAVAAGGMISLFQDVTGASTRRDYPGVGLTGGLAFSADGSRMLAVGPRSVVVVDRVSGDQRTVVLDFQPTGIAAMGGLFRLNQAGSGPLWLLDGAAAEPKVWFVPARAGL